MRKTPSSAVRQIDELVVHLPEALGEALGDAGEEAVGDLGIGEVKATKALLGNEPNFGFGRCLNRGAGRSGIKDTDFADGVASFQASDPFLLAIAALEDGELALEDEEQVVVHLSLANDDVVLGVRA